MRQYRVMLVAVLAVLFALYYLLTLPRDSCRHSGSVDTPGAWACVESLPTARSELAATVWGETIYTAGGLNRWGRSRAFESYDAVTHTWNRLPPTPTVVHHAAMASLDGKIYLVGGYEDLTLSRPLSTAWSFDILMRRWSRIADMPEPRSAHGMVAVGRKLYVVGGDSSTAEPASVLAYDPGSDRWQRLASRMPTLREHLSVIAAGDKIYALGGRWRGTNLAAVEVWDVSANSWAGAMPMLTARSGFAAGYVDGKIHVVGGESLTSLKTISSHEVYDPALNSWSRFDRSDPVPLHGVASAVIGNQWFVLGGAECAGYYTPFTVSRSTMMLRAN